jgi:hypothetical protein
MTRYFAGRDPPKNPLIWKIRQIYRLFHQRGHDFLWKKYYLRPFGKRGILRAYLTSSLSIPHLTEGDINPVRGLLPVPLPVMVVPVILGSVDLDLNGRVRQDIEPAVRPLVLCPHPELAEHVRRDREISEIPDFVRELVLDDAVHIKSIPHFFQFYCNHDSVAVQEAIERYGPVGVLCPMVTHPFSPFSCLSFQVRSFASPHDSLLSNNCS